MVESCDGKKINKNDELQVDIQYAGNPDNVFYSLVFIYNFDIVATHSYEYTSFAFRIWDHLNSFTSTDTSLLVRVSLYDPQYFMPQQSSYNIQVNLEPIPGTFTITPSSGSALSTDFTLQLTDFFDEDQPLSYRYSYYTSETDYEGEKFSGNSPVSNSRNLLNDFSNENSFTTYLPPGDLG